MQPLLVLWPYRSFPTMGTNGNKCRLLLTEDPALEAQPQHKVTPLKHFGLLKGGGAKKNPFFELPWYPSNSSEVYGIGYKAGKPSAKRALGPTVSWPATSCTPHQPRVKDCTSAPPMDEVVHVALLHVANS